MKKNILSILYWGIMAISCTSDVGEGVAATEITNLRLQSNAGSIDLVWEYPEGDNTNRYVEIRYYDPGKKKNVLKTVSGNVCSATIEDTRKKYGEYTFHVQPFSSTFSAGTSCQISGESGIAPAIDTFTSQEIIPDEEDITMSGYQADGSVIDPPTADSDYLTNVLDGKLNTRVNANYHKAKTGSYFDIDVVYHKPQKYLQFSYTAPNKGNLPSEIECYVKANTDDEWMKIATLTTENDRLPTKADGTLFKSKEYEASFEFSHFRFRVLKTYSGAVNFSLAEFRIFNVEHYHYDPEADE
jgi:F5/8 type C domain protein